MSHSENANPRLSCDSYIAVTLQPRVYGCRNKEDVRKNLDNRLRLIDDSMYTSWLMGGGPVKLVTLPEGAIQGMWDEMSHMDQAAYCRDIAITIPGEETDRLAEKAKQYNIYIAAQAKVIIVAPNFGPYFTHPGIGETYSICGGNSMIVDYRGTIVTKADHGNETAVPGEIDIKKLRQYRTESPQALILTQMRSGLWKQIYERWPDYPKNLYLFYVAQRKGLYQL